LKEKIGLHLPDKVPYVEVKKAEYFFRILKTLYEREGFISVQYNFDLRKYRLYVPHQRASAGHVCPEEPLIETNGFRPIMTMHSHMGEPFFSSGDRVGEQYGSGIHLVAGNLEKAQPDWVAVLCVHGRRKDIDPGEVLELEIPKPTEWINKIALGRKIDGALGL
jgi:hypothetical protein